MSDAEALPDRGGEGGTKKVAGSKDLSSVSSSPSGRLNTPTLCSLSSATKPPVSARNLFAFIFLVTVPLSLKIEARSGRSSLSSFSSIVRSRRFGSMSCPGHSSNDVSSCVRPAPEVGAESSKGGLLERRLASSLAGCGKVRDCWPSTAAILTGFSPLAFNSC